MYVLIALALVALQAAILFALGRVPICTCGTIKLWQSTVNSSENSQHIFDWYTPSHVIHGILFYFALWLIFPKAPVMTRFLLALGIEVGLGDRREHALRDRALSQRHDFAQL